MIVLAHNRCPLCGGRILHGECAECGYKLPDEDRLSAPYNLDPEDDRPEAFEPLPEKYEIPAAQAIPNRPYAEQDGGNAAPVKERSEAKMPNIKVAPTQTPFNNPYAPNNRQNNAPAQNAQQNNQQGWRNPYSYNPAQRQTKNPANTTYSSQSQRGITGVLVLLLVLSFFSPVWGILGIILNASPAAKLDRKKRELFTILFIIAVIISNIMRS